MPKLNIKIVRVPDEWVANGAQGIAIGQCVIEALQGRIGRAMGLGYETRAHAHSTMFEVDRNPTSPTYGQPTTALEEFGWICTVPLDHKRHGEVVTKDLGLIRDDRLVVPGRLAFHEYAHILTPWELRKGDPTETQDGHGAMWRNQITELGYPEEATRYLYRLNARRGPAWDAGFRPGQEVWLSLNVTPKYLRNAKATVVRVGSKQLRLEFEDFETNTTIWPYTSVSHASIKVTTN